jgi:hypothetical protein
MKTINHYISKDINFIMVGIYAGMNEINFYGYFEKSNIHTDKHTIGIWKIKYKNQK